LLPLDIQPIEAILYDVSIFNKRRHLFYSYYRGFRQEKNKPVCHFDVKYLPGLDLCWMDCRTRMGFHT
jgi:hypothetical protein